jgi:MarR family transcriptional regulator for hemolysin
MTTTDDGLHDLIRNGPSGHDFVMREIPGALVDEDQNLGFLIMDVLRLMRADFRNRARTIPLTIELHAALMLLHKHPGCRQVQLARWLEVAPATVIRMLERLERMKLVRRETDPNDRRSVRVHLTPQAAPLMQRLLEITSLSRERAFVDFSAAERRQLTAGLRRLRKNLSEEGPAPQSKSRRVPAQRAAGARVATQKRKTRS